MKEQIFFLHVFFVLAGCQSTSYINKGLLYCIESEGPYFDQKGSQRCGPTSFLHLLKFSPFPYRAAFNNLCFNEDKLLDNFVERYTAPQKTEGKAVFHEETGMDDENLIVLAGLVCEDYQLAPLEHLFTNRLQGESDREFCLRINNSILNSIKSGIPLVMSIDSYGTRNKKWNKLSGHYMLISGVQPVRATNAKGFLIEYINSFGGEKHQAYISADSYRPSAAYAHFLKGDEWLENDPYLYVSIPNLNLSQSEQPWHTRHEYYLTFLLGDLD